MLLLLVLSVIASFYSILPVALCSIFSGYLLNSQDVLIEEMSSWQ
jgi:hypothetical protein